MRIAVVGPSKAGKTVYLACLLRAAFAGRRAARPIKVRPDPGNPPAVALDRSAVDVLRGSAPVATNAVTHCELFADLPGSMFFGIGRETLRISMVDVPGGDCMPPDGQPVDPALAQSVAEADALLIMIPADAAARPTDFCRRLAHLANASGRLIRRNGSDHRFLRIAVVMSMAELLVADRGGDALRSLDAMDPQREIAKACGQDIVATVRSIVPAGGDWYSLVSAFGFDSHTGEIASEHTAAGWRVKTNGREFRDGWYPYRAFEPLEFLGRGVCWREVM